MEPEPKLLLKLERDRRTNKKWVLQKDNMEDIFDSIADHPVAVITIVGPPNKGKSVLFANIARYLNQVDQPEGNWRDIQEPIERVNWPNPHKKAAGIWSYHTSFRFNDIGRRHHNEMAVLLLYVHSFENNFWETEHPDICALLGLSQAISSQLIINAYKELNEDCLHGISVYLKYAVKIIGENLGKPSRKTIVPFQDATFLIRDWSLPCAEFAYGAKGGDHYVHEKLLEKPEHSRKSRQSRKLINGLFQNITGFLLPYPGTKYIKSTYTRDDKLNEADDEFQESLTSAVELIARIDKLSLKADVFGHELNGRLLKEMIERFVDEQETFRDVNLSTGTVLEKFGIHYEVSTDEQKECIGAGIQAYLQEWRQREARGEFFDNSTMAKIHKRALDNARDALQHEVCEGDEIEYPVNRAVWRLFEEKVERKRAQMEQANIQRKIAVMEEDSIKAVHQYDRKLQSMFSASGSDFTEHYVRSYSKGARTKAFEEFLDRFFLTGVDEASQEENKILQKLQSMLADCEEQLVGRLFKGNTFNNEN